MNLLHLNIAVHWPTNVWPVGMIARKICSTIELGIFKIHYVTEHFIPKEYLSLVFYDNRNLKISKSMKSEQYFRDKIQIFIRPFDKHFARHFESHLPPPLVITDHKKKNVITFLFASIFSSLSSSVSCSFNAWAKLDTKDSFRFKLPPAVISPRFSSNSFVRSSAVGFSSFGLTCQRKIKALSRELSWVIGHAWHIKILTWLRGFLVIFLYLIWFSFRSSLFEELRDNGVVESLKTLSYLGVTLEFWYIERELFEVSMEFSPK